MICKLDEDLGLCSYVLNDIDSLWFALYWNDLDYSILDEKIIDIYNPLDWIKIDFTTAVVTINYDAITELYTSNLTLTFVNEELEDELSNLFDKSFFILLKDNSDNYFIDSIQEFDNGYRVSEFTNDLDLITNTGNGLKIVLSKVSKYNITTINSEYITFNNIH
jgi:hypothetical protein